MVPDPGGRLSRAVDRQFSEPAQMILTWAPDDQVMAENETQTVLIPRGTSSAAPGDPAQPHQAGAPAPGWAVPADAPHASAADPVAPGPEGASAGPAGPVPPSYGAAEYPVPPQRRPSFTDRLRTPIAGAVLGGVVILGAGFAAGFVVGQDHASSSSTSVPDGQFGRFGPGTQGGPGGQFGQGGQTGQVGPGGQTDGGTGGSGVPGTAQQGTTQQGTTAQQGDTQ
jgi:hypothetical protein